MKCYIAFIAVLDGVAVSSNKGNLRTNFSSVNCSGQQNNEFIVATNFHAETHVQINFVAHKYIAVIHTHNYGVSSYCLVEKNITKSLRSTPASLHQSMLQLLEQQGKTERKSEFRTGQ